MAGLLDFVLPAIFSAGDSAKRQIKGLLGDPVGTVKQFINNKNDEAAAHLADVKQSTQGRMTGLLGGQATPEQLAADQRWTQALANAYNPAGMIVWHGSPHNFTKFDASKIGTGEGAQAYGHGLYLAESPEVADGYRKALSKSVSVDGAKLQTIPSDGPLAEAHNMVVRNIQSGMNPENAIAATQKYWLDAGDEMRSFAKTNPELAGRIEKEVAGRLQVSDAAKTLKPSSFYLDPGSLYKVDLPDSAIARMLDWDKPLSQQANLGRISELRVVKNPSPAYSDEKWLITAGSDNLDDAINAFGTRKDALNKLPEITGGQLWKSLEPSGAVHAVNVLKRNGIPGIRYLDGGSRGAGVGTSNFVVFPGEESLLTILERNGVPLR